MSGRRAAGRSWTTRWDQEVAHGSPRCQGGPATAVLGRASFTRTPRGPSSSSLSANSGPPDSAVIRPARRRGRGRAPVAPPGCRCWWADRQGAHWRTHGPRLAPSGASHPQRDHVGPSRSRAGIAMASFSSSAGGSWRFFSQPERPSFTFPLSAGRVDVGEALQPPWPPWPGAGRHFPPPDRSRRYAEIGNRDAGTSTRVLRGENTSAGASSTDIASTSLAVQRRVPCR